MACKNYGGNSKCELREPSYEIPQERIITMCISTTEAYLDCPELVQLKSKRSLDAVIETHPASASPRLGTAASRINTHLD